MTNNILVAVSGKGRSLENLLEYCHTEQPAWKVGGVLSSSQNCGAIGLAKNWNVPVFFLDQQNPEERLTALKHAVHVTQARLIVLAGFLKLFPLVSSPELPVINIHPALLPAYGGKGMYGLRVHQAVIDAGDKISGATVHYVNEVYDSGSIIAKREVEVRAADCADDLAARVFAAECLLLPQVISELLEMQES